MALFKNDHTLVTSSWDTTIKITQFQTKLDLGEQIMADTALIPTEKSTVKKLCSYCNRSTEECKDNVCEALTLLNTGYWEPSSPQNYSSGLYSKVLFDKKGGMETVFPDVHNVHKKGVKKQVSCVKFSKNAEFVFICYKLDCIVEVYNYSRDDSLTRVLKLVTECSGVQSSGYSSLDIWEDKTGTTFNVVTGGMDGKLTTVLGICITDIKPAGVPFSYPPENIESLHSKKEKGSIKKGTIQAVKFNNAHGDMIVSGCNANIINVWSVIRIFL